MEMGLLNVFLVYQSMYKWSHLLFKKIWRKGNTSVYCWWECKFDEGYSENRWKFKPFKKNYNGLLAVHGLGIPASNVGVAWVQILGQGTRTACCVVWLKAFKTLKKN